MLKILSYPSFQQVIAKLDYKTAGGKKNLLAVSAISLGVFLVYDSVFGGQHVYKQSCIFYARHFAEKKSIYDIDEQELFKLLEDSSCFEEVAERLNVDIPEDKFKELIELLVELIYKSPWKGINSAIDRNLASRRQVAASSLTVYGTYFPGVPFWMKFLPPYFPSSIHPKIIDFSRLVLFVTSVKYLIGELQVEFSKLKAFKGFKSLSFLFRELETKKEYRSLRIVSALVVVIGTILYKSDIKLPTGLKAYLNHFPPTAPYSPEEEHDNHEIPICLGRALMEFCLKGKDRLIFVKGDGDIAESIFKSGIRLSKLEHAFGRQEEPLFFPFDLNEYPPRHPSDRDYEKWKVTMQDLRSKLSIAQNPILIIDSKQLKKDPYFQQELAWFIKACFDAKKELKIMIRGADDYQGVLDKYTWLKEILESSLENFSIKIWKSDSTLLEKSGKEELINFDNLLFFTEENWLKKTEGLFNKVDRKKITEFISGAIKDLQSINNEDLEKYLKDFEELKSRLKKQDLEIKELAYRFLDKYKWWFASKPLSIDQLNKSALRFEVIKILLMKKGLEKKILKEAFDIQKQVNGIYGKYFEKRSIVFPQK